MNSSIYKRSYQLCFSLMMSSLVVLVPSCSRKVVDLSNPQIVVDPPYTNNSEGDYAAITALEALNYLSQNVFSRCTNEEDLYEAFGSEIKSFQAKIKFSTIPGNSNALVMNIVSQYFTVDNCSNENTSLEIVSQYQLSLPKVSSSIKHVFEANFLMMDRYIANKASNKNFLTFINYTQEVDPKLRDQLGICSTGLNVKESDVNSLTQSPISLVGKTCNVYPENNEPEHFTKGNNFYSIMALSASATAEKNDFKKLIMGYIDTESSPADGSSEQKRLTEITSDIGFDRQ